MCDGYVTEINMWYVCNRMLRYSIMQLLHNTAVSQLEGRRPDRRQV
jgi:hypothetical protein